ncbi:MAG: hypothetical protein FGM50_10175, partial [Mycobacterium sp.]|nr:hypothetical protein [Mycobacterium sp.]
MGMLRLIDDGDGQWSLTPVTRPTHYVGRVGALAIALGVGGVIAGAPAALADTGTETSAGAADTAAERPAGPRSRAGADERPKIAAPRTGRGGRDDSGTPRSRGTETPTDDDGPAPAAERASVARAVATPEVAVPEVALPDVALPEVALPDVEITPPAAVAAQTAPIAGTPASASVLSAAAERTSLAAATGPADGLAPGSDPLTPLAMPLAWTMVAASRRELSAAAIANPVAAIIRVFVGDGTADNPNAGLLYGNGYSYTAYEGACVSGACNGGSGG